MPDLDRRHSLDALWTRDAPAAAKIVLHVLRDELARSGLYRTRLVDKAARRLGVSRRTLFYWLKEKPELKGWSQ
jgi:transposase-like protein